MAFHRPRRVGELIRQELSQLLANRLRDPRLAEVILTEVEMSPDLKRAFIYFVGPAGREGDIAAGLAQAAGFIRRELAPRLKLKFMPELVYRFDDSLDKGQTMDRVLASLQAEPPREEGQ